MGELYTDNEPEYRAARVKSGIPPPSLRDQRNRPPRHGGDLSSFNPAMQRGRNPPYDPRQRDYPRQHDRYSSHDQRYPEQRQAYSGQQQRPAYPERHDTRYSDQRYSEQRHSEHRQTERYPEQQRPHDQRYPEQQQQQQQQRPPVAPAVSKPKPLDLRTSTDFLKCEKRLSMNALVELIQVSEAPIDVDFLSSKGLVEKVNSLREKIRDVPNEQRSQARSKSNPFERIGSGGMFMNRAATKLAAMDATFGLTSIQDASKEFQFADICGGPGGFSEYLLWRIHSWGGSGHGYGVTLKSDQHDEMNWHTEKFRKDIPGDSLSRLEGSGDVYRRETMEGFEKMVMEGTKRRGVDLAVADGGIDFSGSEEQQERLAQRLVLCEIVSMLTCLKQGGHFVCKFFDILDEFTADLVWLLYQLFEEICITKPLSSRPANSERYVVCKGLLVHHPTELIQKLIEVSESIQDTCGDGKRFVPKDVLEKDEDFIDYVKMRNMKFVMKQTEALEQLDQFIQNPELAPFYDQEQIKKHCLNEWRIPLPY
ncbi:FtsJ-like methyltransferase-domain-containing protein [Pilaira anomala]|nr:FtsJ-like methyltransferase-domain-containing protein [Pilaira anomala]